MAVPGRRVAMVGRADELAVLSRLWSADVGAMVLVTGEAGVGKTRLLAELADRVAGGGPPVLEGHAVQGGGAYRPLAEALTRSARPRLGADERLAPYRAVLGRLLPGWASAVPLQASALLSRLPT